jgi:hypothetical protein
LRRGQSLKQQSCRTLQNYKVLKFGRMKNTAGREGRPDAAFLRQLYGGLFDDRVAREHGGADGDGVCED